MSDDLEVAEGRRIRHLSPTKIETFAFKCPEQVRLRYVEKIPEPESGFLFTGTVVHAVIERALKRVLLGGSLPNPKDADDLFLENWKKDKEIREAKPGFLGWQWDKDDPEPQAFNECRALVQFSLAEVLPHIKPKLVEEDAKLEYESEVGPFLVWGKLDLVSEDLVLSDWKTTKKVSRNALESWIQFAHYSRYIHEVLGGAPVTEARKIFLVRGPKPDVTIKPYKITEAMRTWFARIAANVWKACQADAFVPNTTGWCCSPKYCAFHAMCQEDLP